MAEQRRGGKKHNLIRSAKNRATGKYVRQAKRTAANKERRALGQALRVGFRPEGVALAVRQKKRAKRRVSAA